MINPTPVALAISMAYGYHFPRPMTALRWVPCPQCARQYGERLTLCEDCGNLGRVPILPAPAPRNVLQPGRLLA